MRERGVGKASKLLSAEGAILCDTYEAGAGPPGLDDLFADDPRPYGTWLFNVGPSGLWLRPGPRCEVTSFRQESLMLLSVEDRPRVGS